MQVNQPLLATVGFIAAAVVTLVDGRNAVSIASIAAAAGLTPAVAGGYGAGAALLLLGAGLSAATAVPITRTLAHRVSWAPGVDPLVPVVAAPDSLFGPRSVRVLCGVLVLPAASWVSFNVPIGSAATVTGVMFPAAVMWGCGAVRLLTARTVADLAIGVAATGLAGAAGWLLSGGDDAITTASAAAALAPAAAAVAGWLSGRHAASRHPA